MRRKYRRRFSSSECPKQPGPQGPSEALIQAIVELKSRLVGQKKAAAIAVKNVSGRRRWSKLDEWLGSKVT